MVGVATYDTAIHFYSLTPNQSQPQMLVMPDISDVYAPLSAPLVGRAVDVHETISAVLQAIPGYFAETSIRDSCGAAAVEVGTCCGGCGCGCWMLPWRPLHAVHPAPAAGTPWYVPVQHLLLL